MSTVYTGLARLIGDNMKVEFNFETISSGQPGAYLDAKNVVLIKDKSDFPMNDGMTEAVLMSILLQRYEPRVGTPIDSTQKLEKTGDREWIFKQHMPFTD